MEFGDSRRTPVPRGSQACEAWDACSGGCPPRRDPHCRDAPKFADAEVDGWQPLEGTFGLPDPDDEHVLAAAVIAGAGAIVTENLKDFPADRIPPGIQVLSAREFAKNTVALNPRLALAAVHEIASRSGRYGATLAVGEILETLRDRYGMIEAVEMMLKPSRRRLQIAR
jgi:hypothetical protein